MIILEARWSPESAARDRTPLAASFGLRCARGFSMPVPRRSFHASPLHA